jgi:hypothetical protein
MKRAMRPVLELLKDRVKESNDYDESILDQKPINDAIEESQLTSIFDVEPTDTFIRPTLEVVSREITQRRISYVVENDLLERVKEALGVGTNKQAGEFTFNYFVENEL